MCGLTAVLNSEAARVPGLDDFITDATVATQLRGMDSTGMYQVTSNLELASYKKAVDGTTFVGLARAANMLGDADMSYVTVVHNRKATTGKINDRNAHPFVHENDDGDDDFALVHNGTITNWDSRKFDTDTHALASMVNQQGPQALDELCGAWSVIWTDMESQMTYMATNGERPLHYAFVKDKSVVIIASEAGMLSWLAERNKLQLQDDAIYEAETHQTYAFPMHDVRDFTKTPIKQVTPQTYRTNQRTTYDTRRETMLGTIKEIERQARAGTLTPESATTVVALTPGIDSQRIRGGATDDERDLLYSWTNEHEFICNATPIYKDDANYNVYLDVIPDGNPYSHAGSNDCVVVRCNSSSQAANMMRYHSVEVTVVGIDEQGYLVALPPTTGQLQRGVLTSMRHMGQTAMNY